MNHTFFPCSKVQSPHTKINNNKEVKSLEFITFFGKKSPNSDAYKETEHPDPAAFGKTNLISTSMNFWGWLLLSATGNIDLIFKSP